MQRILNERQIDEFKATALFIDYLTTNPEPKDYELADGMVKLLKVGELIDQSENKEDLINEINEIFDLEKAQEFQKKYIIAYIKEQIIGKK